MQIVKIICLLLVISLYDKVVIAQTKPVTKQQALRGQIISRAKPYTNKIALRWNTNNHLLFHQLCKEGVVIDRLILNDKNKAESDWKRVTSDTIKAWPLQRFNQPNILKDSGKIIIAQCLYGQSTIKSSVNFFETLKSQDEESENKYFIASLYASLNPENAAVAGIGFEDNITVDATKKYVYRIIPKYVETQKLDTGFVVVLGADVNSSAEVLHVKPISLDRSVLLKWPSKINHFTAYVIEHSTDGVNFQKVHKNYYVAKIDTLNNEPYYNFLDSIPNYTKYFYRITGINSFGDRYVSKDTIIGMAQDLTPPQPVLLTYEQKDRNIIFKWDKPTDKDIETMYLITGKNYNANDSAITKQGLPINKNSFTLQLPEKYSAGYYRILLIDSNKNHNYSNQVYVFMPDHVPPATPQNFTGKIDTTGNIIFAWNGDNTELLRGYKILMANDPTHAYIPITDLIQDTTYSYKTTLKTLSKNVYFKVVAVDGSYNHSQSTEAIAIKRPLKIKPEKPVFLSFYNGVNGITLVWSNANLDNFKHFELKRKDKEGSNWSVIQRTQNTTYTDTTAVLGKEYIYTLQLVSNENIYSDDAPFITLVVNKKNIDEKIALSLSRTEKNIMLQWIMPQKRVKYFLLYKNSGKGLTMYKNIEAGKTSFTETINEAGLEYGLKVMYEDNIQSELFKTKEK